MTDLAQPTSPERLPSAARDPRGRFRANDPSFHRTLDLIAEVAEHAAEGHEGLVSVGAPRFDAAREEMGVALPSAQALVKRFRLPLSRLIEMAEEPAAARALAAGHDTANEVEDDFPSELMLHGIRAAGRRAGHTPSALAYDRWVADDNEAREARHVPTNGLPHSATIERRFGSWQDALEAAGFEIEHPSSRRRAEDAAVLLNRFITEHGFLPASGYFSEYCRLKAIPLGRDFKPWDGVLARCKAIRDERGDEMPTAMPGPSERPALEDITGGGSGRASRACTREQAIASLRRYRDEGLRAGETPSTRGYRAFCRGREGLVSESTISEHWGFVALCEEAGI